MPQGRGRDRGAAETPPGKVVLCHNGHEIAVAEPAVPAHLAQGDTLGACSAPVGGCAYIPCINACIEEAGCAQTLCERGCGQFCSDSACCSPAFCNPKSWLPNIVTCAIPACSSR
jgi:hypothetical protein